jgi:transposase
MIHAIIGLATDWRRLDERVEEVSAEIEALASKDAGCGRLITVIGGGDMFMKGRDFGAWLGIVPRGHRCAGDDGANARQPRLGVPGGIIILA